MRAVFFSGLCLLAACSSSADPSSPVDAGLADVGAHPDASDFAAPLFESTEIAATSATHVALALGPSDAPIVAYNAEGSVKVARLAGAAWQVEDVSLLDGTSIDVQTSPSGRTAVAFEASDDAHVSTSDGAAWSDESAGRTGTDVALVLASDGSPRLASGALYLWKGTNGWEQESIDTHATGTSLALAGSSTTAVAYYDPVSREVRFAVRGAGAWRAEKIAGYAFGAATVDTTALAFAADGTAYVAWSDDTNLRVAARSAGTWQIEDVARASRARTRIAVDRAGRVHVAHAGTIYARRDAAGTWAVTRLGTSDQSTSGFAALALDAADRPHLVFADTFGRHLYYLAPR